MIWIKLILLFLLTWIVSTVALMLVGAMLFFGAPIFCLIASSKHVLEKINSSNEREIKEK